MTVTYTRTTWSDGVVRHTVERRSERSSVAVSVQVAPVVDGRVDVPMIDVEVDGRMAARVYCDGQCAIEDGIAAAIAQSAALQVRWTPLADAAWECGRDVLREVTA